MRRINDQIVEVSNQKVIKQIKQTKADPDTGYGYRKMYTDLMILGYYINHKKVYRIMEEQHLLKERYERISKNYVKYRTVIPEGPLEVLEVDIKYVWVTQA